MSTVRVLLVLALVSFVAACSDGNTAVQQTSAAAAESMEDTTAYLAMWRYTPTTMMPEDSFYTDVDSSGEGVQASRPATVLDTVPPGAIMDMR